MKANCELFWSLNLFCQVPGAVHELVGQKQGVRSQEPGVRGQEPGMPGAVQGAGGSEAKARIYLSIQGQVLCEGQNKWWCRGGRAYRTLGINV